MSRVTPAIRLPLRRLPRPSVIVSVGVVVLAFSAAFSLAGLPAPGGLAQGAGDASSPSPAPSDGPVSGPPVVDVGGGGRSVGRHATPPQDLCRRGPRSLEPAVVASHGPRDAKVIALTFDDGWGGRTLLRILHVLQDRKVNATFFPVGQAVLHDPSTWRRIAQAGFPIADHTYDHAKLKGMCYSEQRRELSRARSIFSRTLNVEPLPVMRPPGGFFDDATLAAAAAAGESTLVLWDVDTSDWSGIGTRQVRRNALAGTKGSVIVLHTSSVATLRALPAIIRTYRKRGFEFVTIGQLLGIQGEVPFPPQDEG